MAPLDDLGEDEEELPEPEERGEREETKRDDELSGRADLREDLLKLYEDVDKGFDSQRTRTDENMDYWEAYNCILGSKQFYNGTSQIYVPIVRSAVNARKTRFVNQMFPQNGKYIECLTTDGEIPHALISLLGNYVTKTKLRTQILPALCVAGDIEGQYTIYVDWQERVRHVVYRDEEPVKAMGLEHPELGKVETRVHEKLIDAEPRVEVISDADFVVLPVTADAIDDALYEGGSVTVLRRWSKAKIRQMIAEKEIVEDEGEDLLEAMQSQDVAGSKNEQMKALVSAAGLKTSDGGKFALVYEVWSRQEVDGERRLTRTYFGGPEIILGCKLNPYWNDRCPVISGAVNKIPGVFKGMSLIKPGILDLQIQANDAMNQGGDNLSYSLNPVTMVDPQAVARWESLVLDLGAVWPVAPNAAKVMEFPNISQQALAVVSNCKNEIFQNLSVNSSMIPAGGATKRNQAMVAQEQQVDILTTADSVTVIENEIASPLVQRFADLDHQFRDNDMMIPKFGEMGLRAAVETIPPIQAGHHFQIKWLGVEAARNAAANQQKTAFLNVLRGMKQDLMKDFDLNIAPLILQQAEDLFGPELAPLILVSKKNQLSVDPEIENDLLKQGMTVPVHMADDDPKHLEAHQKILAETGDYSGFIRVHIQMHQAQLQAKQMMAQQQAAQQAQQGGAQGVPGVAGTPQPGSQPQPPNPRGPPGQIHPDQMGAADPSQMPRRM